MSAEDINKIKDDITNIRINLATITGDISATKDSVGILNHNSTSLDIRVANLENKQVTNEAIKVYLDNIRNSTRNWVLLCCAIIGTLVTIFTFWRSFGL